MLGDRLAAACRHPPESGEPHSSERRSGNIGMTGVSNRPRRSSAAGELGVPKRSTLLVVAVDRAQQRVDVHERALPDAEPAAAPAARAQPDALDLPRRAGWRARR